MQKTKMNNQSVAYAGATGGAMKLPDFPKEFQMGFLERFDKRYYNIFFACLIAMTAMLNYLSGIEIYDKTSLEAKEAFKKRIVRFVLDRNVIEPQKEIDLPNNLEKENLPTKIAEDQLKQENIRDRRQPKKMSREELARQRRIRRKRNEDMLEGLGDQNLLAFIMNREGRESGATQRNILSDMSASNSVNLDETLENSTPTRTSQWNENRIRRARSEKRSGITGDNESLVEGIGVASESEFGTRQGKLTIEKPGNTKKEVLQNAYRDTEMIQQTIDKFLPAFQFCYRQQTMKNPNLRGEVRIQFTILYNGKVKKTKIISSTLNSTAVERCITQKISRLKFAPINKKEGNLTITQTFSFGL